MKKSPMILTDLRIEKEAYGDNRGKYKGKARFTSEQADVAVTITHEQSVAILEMCADSMLAAAKDLSEVMRGNIIEGMSLEGSGKKLLK